MKLDDLRKLAKNTIDPGEHREVFSQFVLTIQNEWSESIINKELKRTADFMSSDLGWKVGTQLIIREGMEDKRISIATINSEGKIWICELSNEDTSTVIRIPSYNSVKNKLGVRISVDSHFFDSEKVVNLLDRIKEVVISKCMWPSTSSLSVERDPMSYSFNVGIEDGRGNYFLCASIDRIEEGVRVVHLDFPHYHSFQ